MPLSQKVDLFTIGGERRPWEHGDSYGSETIERPPVLINKWFKESKSPYILIWSSQFSLPDLEDLEQCIQDQRDVYHAGLHLGQQELLSTQTYINPAWMLNLTPTISERSPSWKLSFWACLIKREVFEQCGEVNESFESLAMAGLEWGHRCLLSGAQIFNEPKLLDSAYHSAQKEEVPLRDEFLFHHLGLGKKWSMFLWLRGLYKPSYWKAYMQMKALKVQKPQRTIFKSNIKLESKEYPSVSVVIPTLNRYQVLPQALECLKNQTVKPLEVICVDQTPEEHRKPEFYQSHPEIDLKVFWHDILGQGRARNRGIVEAKGEYVLSFDDDTWCGPEFIEEHLKLLTEQKADATTGVMTVLPENDHVRIADVFDSGNAMFRREDAIQLGGFDLQFDRMTTGDHELGTRFTLAGKLLLNNPFSKREEIQAEVGGLRHFGIFKGNQKGQLLKPRPVPSKIYYLKMYYSKMAVAHAIFFHLIGLATRDFSGQKAKGLVMKCFWLSLEMFMLPLTLLRLRASLIKANQMIRNGPIRLISKKD